MPPQTTAPPPARGTAASAPPISQEKEVPVVKLTRRPDGVFVSPVPQSRETFRTAIRAERDAF